MIAFHYPPMKGSSGLQRALKFSQYMVEHDWEPIVLSVNPMAYQKTGDEQIKEIPECAIVRRIFALDTAKHLSIFGIYPRFLALPDRWSSWWFGAVLDGLLQIRKYKPQIIWSTYPIATAHLIAYTLHRITSIPWVADFRDLMVDEYYPTGKLERMSYQWIEKKTVTHASRIVFTTQGAITHYSKLYPNIPKSRWVCIPNGYDEKNFQDAMKLTINESGNSKINLIHSGILYLSDRDPVQFFSALSELLVSGEISKDKLKITLRASGNEAYFAEIIKEKGIEEIVVLAEGIPYLQALAEMLAADGLIIFQGSSCNNQVPAKIYEYLRARKPILALTDPKGDTAQQLKICNINTIVPLDSKEEIKKGLLKFLEEITNGTAAVASDKEIQAFSRMKQTQRLIRLFDDIK
jgi:hypothetical protein